MGFESSGRDLSSLEKEGVSNRKVQLTFQISREKD